MTKVPSKMSPTWKVSNYHHQGPLQIFPTWKESTDSLRVHLQTSPALEECNEHHLGAL